MAFSRLACVGPQLTIAPQAASTALAVCFRPGVGLGLVGVVARQRAVADAAVRLRLFVQRNQFFVVLDALLEELVLQATARRAPRADVRPSGVSLWKYSSVCLSSASSSALRLVRK